MNRKFLDNLYERRSEIQLEINDLVESGKNTQCKCETCERTSGDDNRIILAEKRNQIQMVNGFIDNYLYHQR